MKTRIERLGAVVALMILCAGMALGDGTQVEVSQGVVEAQTATGSLKVGAGRMAMLKRGSLPRLGVADPLVEDVIQLVGWLEDEKHAGEVEIDSAVIQAIDIVRPGSIRAAAYAEYSNDSGETVSVQRLGPTGIFPGLRLYDLEGNQLTYEVEILEERAEFGLPLGYIDVTLSQPVAPGQTFRQIMVTEVPEAVADALCYRRGDLWHFWAANETVDSLNFFKIVLPESAVLVHWTQPLKTVESREGRIAVTFRNYTGEKAEGRLDLSFTMQERD